MERPLQISFKEMESSGFLERLIRKRVDRLERSHPNVIGCRVVVEVAHRGGASGKPPIGIAAEIEVPGHKKIVAKGESDRREKKDDRNAVINRVFDAAQRQLESLADVQSGTVKQHGSVGETGAIAQLFPAEGYGLVEVKGAPNLYFTRNAVGGGAFDELQVGTMVLVTRATTEGPMGPQASSVKLLDGGRTPS
jgi:hypothetical protein